MLNNKVYTKKCIICGKLFETICVRALTCGKDCRNLEIHQVKKLKDLKGNAEWVLLMRKRRRKTLVVCPECHKLIHS